MKLSNLLCILLLCSIGNVLAQPTPLNTSPKKPENILFTAGLANSLIGGLYSGFYNYRELKKHGNFGLGAPDKLDGELLVLGGKIYQTQYTGKTFEVKDTDKTPFAVVNFFHADKIIKLTKKLNKVELFQYIDSVLNNPNGIYAIHVVGNFQYVKTRAFPPVENDSITPLAEMLNKQRFFEFKNIAGDLVGHRLPAYMEGANITGYHLHFLSEQKNKGGHIIDFIATDVTIEIDLLKSFVVDVPNTTSFKNFDFKKDRKEEVKSVENGQK